MCECQSKFDYLHAKLHDAIMRDDQESITNLLTVHPVNEPINIWKNCTLAPIYQNQVNPNGALKVLYIVEELLTTYACLYFLQQPLGLSILPIHLAATYRKVGSLECLIRHKADLEAKDARGRSSLHHALMHWPNIARGCTVPKTKIEKAMAAMQSRASTCLHLMCQQGVDVNATTGAEGRDTPLHLAVRYGVWSAVAVLARHGAELEAADQYGMTPLHMASCLLDSRVTEELLGQGARLDARVLASGCTPLQLAVAATSGKVGRWLGVGMECVRALLAAGAAVNASDCRGRSATHEACFGGQEELVDLLLEHGADLCLRTELGESPLALFLERRPNLRHRRMLAKLLALSCPLRIAGAGGSLPSGIRGPEFRRHREFLQALCRQPPTLYDLCRAAVRRVYSRRQTQQLLPHSVWSFLYSYQEYAERLQEVGAEGLDKRHELGAPAGLDNSLSGLHL
ncbi:ankyrin repeat domain-containing protein 61-like [Hemitrygon akajei]|uniref:ankyrin repeat domain-containing protein 61-like n=1 Tax=Hemitrygon akajei TaxID=2704970 RepID=UPI003BF9D9D3